MRDILIAGNWKMNGGSAGNAKLVAEIIAGAPATGRVRLLICPPFPYLAAAATQVSGSEVLLGAQTVSEHSVGAFTGEISTSMLKDVGCDYVIVGHSERRALYRETSEAVAAKFKAVVENGLAPILCVGETLEEREAGSTEAVIDEQMDAVFNAVGIDGFATAVVAYEPVWAIGTGMTASPEQAQDVHRHIRSCMEAQNKDIAEATLILYGGSVKSDNAAGLFSMPDIDGGLIGGASLKADDFLAIATSAASI